MEKHIRILNVCVSVSHMEKHIYIITVCLGVSNLEKHASNTEPPTLISLVPMALPISARSLRSDDIISVTLFFWWLVISFSFWSSVSMEARELWRRDRTGDTPDGTSSGNQHYIQLWTVFKRYPHYVTRYTDIMCLNLKNTCYIE